MTSYTVTGTATNNTFGGGLLQVEVLTGATLAGTPATVTASAAYNGSITTTQTGSYVLGALSNLVASTSFTASAGCTIINQASINAGGAQAGAFRTTSGTGGSPGPTTVGSSTTFAGTYGMVAVEIIPSGTIAFDASTPAVVSSATLTSFTTASFTPPAGSLLVAILVTTGNFSSTACVATVSSSPGLIWSEQVHFTGDESGTDAYIGVWTAPVPAAGTITPPSWAQKVAVVPFTADVLM